MQKHVFAISELCAQAGITHAVICPGSRSAPLALAFSADKRFSCYSVVDERSAAYMALGMAREQKRPVVLICTSGTATLNFFPAIAEAFFQKIPLLVLTADRPPDLLFQQDGQMIIQKKVYGNHVAASFEMLCYTHGKENLREVAAIVNNAINVAINPYQQAPVHINVPLREPLYEKINRVKKRNVRYKAQQDFSFAKIGRAEMNEWKNAKRKLVLVGSYIPDYDLFHTLLKLSEQPDVVVLSDVLSNQQFTCTAPHFDFILSHSSEKIKEILQPDLIISLGGSVLSKSLKGWLQNQKPNTHFRIQTEKQLVDTYKNVTRFINANPNEWLAPLAFDKNESQTSTWKELWQKINKLAEIRIKKFAEKNSWNELSVTQTVLENLPNATELHLANSSVIRYASWLGSANTSLIYRGNRGTSGIDGCTSTAVGAALTNNRLTVLLTGDVAFLYDKNAFWNNYVPANLKIIVINNNGGGIFTLIPGPAINAAQQHFFTTPHNQSIKQTTLQSGLEYYFCDSLHSLEKTLKTFFEPTGKASVLEIKMDMKQNAKAFEVFKKL